jgi:hypothetical protein
MNQSEFENELSNILGSLDYASIFIRSLEGYLVKHNIVGLFTSMRYISNCFDEIMNFLEKYEEFFVRLDKKFSTKIVNYSTNAKSEINSIRHDIRETKLLLSQNKLGAVQTVVNDIINKFETLRQQSNLLAIIPERIDYSKLDNKDWKMIGVAGLHYKSRVFLSYPFRDNNPRKDQNEQLIIYVKQLLDLLGIQVVTARDYLRPQDPIDDKIVELVKSCNGIIGFYTKGDTFSNVEHELSQNDNIIAVCMETGAEAPSMRLSRLLINFNRNEIGDLLLHLIQALKENKLFRLVIS